jgi:hypothetical protein
MLIGFMTSKSESFPPEPSMEPEENVALEAVVTARIHYVL